MKAYEIVGAYANVMNRLDEAVDPETGEVLSDLEEIFAELEDIQESAEEKVEAMLKAVRNYELTIDTYKAEEARLRKIRQAEEKKAERLSEYLDYLLKGLDVDYKNKKKIQTSIGKIGFQKNPPKFEITDVMQVAKLSKKYPQIFKGLSSDNFHKTELKKLILEKMPDIKDEEEKDLPEVGVKYINNSYHRRVR